MNRLSMSLDQIIDQTETFKKVKHQDAKKAAVVKSATHKENRSVGKFENKKPQFQKSHPAKDVPERSMKIITRERPKVITPDTVQQTIFSAGASSIPPTSSVSANIAKVNPASVFNRLGSTGTYVLFSNLKRTVEEGDIAELCRAIGEIKDVKLTVNFPGNNFARVLFSYERDAIACVAKYHGLTLDGEELHVKIDNIQSQVVPNVSSNVFSRIDTAMKFTVTNSNPVSDATNKRTGLFGTALQNDSNDDEDGGEEEEEMNVPNRGAPRKHLKVVYQDAAAGKDNRKSIPQNTNNRPNRSDGRGQKGNRRPVQKKTNNRTENVTMEDLDNDLESYNAKR